MPSSPYLIAKNHYKLFYGAFKLNSLYSICNEYNYEAYSFSDSLIKKIIAIF